MKSVNKFYTYCTYCVCLRHVESRIILSVYRLRGALIARARHTHRSASAAVQSQVTRLGALSSSTVLGFGISCIETAMRDRSK
uniref:Uncharacterized protein n=1 Tax=Trichogramma kaykai TaxID=54128 RepID=A0ABD2WS54_9HYME